MKTALTNVMMDGALLKSKFRGCMLGSLLGDCYGAPFEGECMSSQKSILQDYFDKLQSLQLFKTPRKMYTDDTAMTKSVARCLIEKPAVDYEFMARMFVKEYLSEPKRGYGENVVEVFHKLRSNKFQDLYQPARDQFKGTGSYGNGGAMRIAPMALYFHNNYAGMLDACRKSTEITHTNKLGVNGALLQCIAVQQALLCDPGERINVDGFVLMLIKKMKEIEVADKDDVCGRLDDEEADYTPYQTQLQHLKKLLDSEYDEEYDDCVIGLLGNSISALYSVPTAVFCFLRAQNRIPSIKTENIFRRTIQYAISLGGDTDTIGSMAGAIAGAYYGVEYIDENLLKHCEFYKETLKMADDLYDIVSNS